MSTKALVWALEQRVGNAPAKLVLVALADCCDANGTCFPSYRHIVGLSELSRSGVKRAMRHLVDLDLVTVEQKTRPNGSQTSNTYHLAVPWRGGSRGDRGGSTVNPLDPVSYPSDSSSLPSGSAAEAGEVFNLKIKDSDIPTDMPTEIWDLFVKLGGKRSLLGKKIKDYGTKAVAGAVGEIVTMKPADPNAVLTKLLQKNPKTGARPDWAVVPRDDNELEAWAVKHGYSRPHQYKHPTFKHYRDDLHNQVRERQEAEAKGGNQ